MVTKISEGVKISVETFYQQDYSNPLQNEFMFAYRITIVNLNPFDIKLLKRHWHIFDADGNRRDIEGEGVVGFTPVIAAYEEYQYVSGCNLHCEMGTMHGSYQMINLDDKTEFFVTTPKFELIVPYKYN